MITKETRIYVTNTECTTPMSFGGFCEAIKGGWDSDNVQITFDQKESQELEERRQVLGRIQEQLKSYNLKFVKRLFDWMNSDLGWHYLNSEKH